MAKLVKLWKNLFTSPLGDIIWVIAYIFMLASICLMFTGNGEFIYEGF